VVCLGTAIVDNPAYGTMRTRMLAVAEQKDMEELQQKFDELQQLLAAKEAELLTFAENVQALEAQVQAAQQQITETETANASLKDQIAQAEAAIQFQARVVQVQTFFSDEELTRKRDFFLAMNDGAFAEYVQDLQKAAAAGSAVAEVTDSAVKVPNLITKPASVGASDIVDYLRSKK
jgi:chromosome segregation ATPase